MRINLAKLVPFFGVGIVLLFFVLAQSSGGDDVDDYDYSYADTTAADAYLDQVAVELAQPGVYVDPVIFPSGRLSSYDAARLDELAATTPGPVRIAVLPADRLLDGAEGDYSRDQAYDPDELVGQLYDRVGVDGTYAILVDAESEYDGRSFTAYQWSEERPFYRVEEALDRAVDCCAPDYDSMLTTFLQHAGEEQTNPWPVIGWVAAGITAVIALLVGGTRWRRRRARRAADEEVADLLRPSLQEEVVELSSTVAALPSVGAGPVEPWTDAVTTRTRHVLDLVEEARHSLDGEDGRTMDTPSEVEDVVRRLADARYELVAIDALRRGEALPERTPPCFFDPRHGPSVGERPYQPEGGAERAVPVCARCQEQLASGQVPAVRTIDRGGLVKPYWEWGTYARPYVNGYWQRSAFADPTMERARRDPVRVLSRPEGSGGGLQFVWESDSSGGSGSSWSSGGGGGGGRSFRGSSGSRRSFGGGSSSRSSRHSGGSRKF